MAQTSLDLPFFSEAHRRLVPAFRDWTRRELGPYEDSEGGDGADAKLIFQKLGQDGWLRHSVDAAGNATGRAPDLRMVCLMREALAYSSAMADVAFSEPWLAILPLALCGSIEQRLHYVPRYCSGSQLLAFALSEPEAGSDVAAIAATVTATHTGFVVDGTKTWTSNSGLADGYVVFGRMPAQPGKAAITAVLVDGSRPEVILERRLRVLSPHTVGTLAFRACPATDHEPVIGGIGGGFQIAMRALEVFRPTVAAACVGFARRAFDEALARCKERRAFGRSIAEHQIIQAKLADMATRINAASMLTYLAAWGSDTGSQEAGANASVAKLFASEAAGAVVDEAVQIFGGMGVVTGTVVERLYRHVRAFRIFDGTSEIQKLIIAKHLLNT